MSRLTLSPDGSVSLDGHPEPLRALLVALAVVFADSPAAFDAETVFSALASGKLRAPVTDLFGSACVIVYDDGAARFELNVAPSALVEAARLVEPWTDFAWPQIRKAVRAHQAALARLAAVDEELARRGAFPRGPDGSEP